MHNQFAHFVGSMVVASFAYIGNAVLAQLDNIPPWVQDLGMPGLMIAVLCYGIHNLHRMYRDSTNERIKDGHEYTAKLEAHIKEGAESRAQLIATSREVVEISKEQLRAQAKTSVDFQHLTNEIRECMKHKP